MPLVDHEHIKHAHAFLSNDKHYSRSTITALRSTVIILLPVNVLVYITVVSDKADKTVSFYSYLATTLIRV